MLVRFIRPAAMLLLAAGLVAPPTLLAQARMRDSAATPVATNDQSVGAALRRSADRHGLWGSLGLGRGAAGLHCAACADGTTHAYTVFGTLGIRLSPRFLVGAETFGWLDVFGGGVDRIARGTYVVARTYGSRHASLYAQGGLGLASFRVNDGEVAFATRSPSASLSVGYDWHVGGFSVSPSVAGIVSTGGSLKSDKTGNAIADNARLGLLRTSVAISWFR